MVRMSINDVSSKLVFVICILAFRLSLDLSYIYIISQHYGYLGYVYTPESFKIIESYLLLLVFAFIFSTKMKQPSHFFIVFLFTFIATPMLSLYSLRNESRMYLYMVLLSLLVTLITTKLPRLKVNTIAFGRTLVIGTLILVTLALFVWIFCRGGFSYFNLNLRLVYDLRREVGSVVFPGFFGYLMTWFGKVFNPLLMAFFLWKRKYYIFFAFLLLQVVFFGVTAHKAMLFYPIIIIFVYIFADKKYFLKMIPLGLFLVVITTSLYYFLTGGLLPTSLFIRRLLYVTVSNHYTYYYFFKKFGHLYMAGSRFMPFLEYPFDMPVQNIISMYLYGHSNTWINTGYLATSYMHFGFIGMLIYSFIVGLIFRLVDSLATLSLPLWLCVAVMVVPIFSLLSADLATAMFTHGILLGLGMLWLMSSKKYIRIKL
jgi:hypothetical protein